MNLSFKIVMIKRSQRYYRLLIDAYKHIDTLKIYISILIIIGLRDDADVSFFLILKPI